jgi:hypothetical protein
LDVERWAELRREHFVRRVPIKDLARRYGIDRNTVRRALRSDRPPRYERPPRPSKLDPFKDEIHRLLRKDARLSGVRVRELIEPSELDGVGVAQLAGRETAPHPGLRGDTPQLRAGGVARPGPAPGRPVEDAEQRTQRHPDPQFEPRAKVFPAPQVHPGLAPAAALSVALEHRPGARLEVVLGPPARATRSTLADGRHGRRRRPHA